MIEVKRSSELEAQVRESFDAIRSGDDQWFADHTPEAGDLLVYGSAPGEEWRGRDAVLSLTLGRSRELNEEAGVREDENPEFECFEAGDTGWVVVHGRFLLADGSSVPTRGVSVFVPDDGKWKRVLFAAQVLAPNELLAPGSPLATRPAET